MDVLVISYPRQTISSLTRGFSGLVFLQPEVTGTDNTTRYHRPPGPCRQFTRRVAHSVCTLLREHDTAPVIRRT